LCTVLEISMVKSATLIFISDDIGILAFL
jgi:hypothetical protein